MQYSFEFDEAKSRASVTKHGISFVEAQDLWLDGDLLRVPARSDAELRFLFIGEIDGVCWTAIVTYRGETIRLISVRRSRPREVQAHEGE